MNERKNNSTAGCAERREKVILAVETERGHYALDAPEMSCEFFSIFVLSSQLVIFFFPCFLCPSLMAIYRGHKHIDTTKSHSVAQPIFSSITLSIHMSTAVVYIS